MVRLKEAAARVFERSDNPNRYELVEEIVNEIPRSEQYYALVEAVRLLIPSLTAEPRRSALARVASVSPKRSIIRAEWDALLAQNLRTPHGYVLMRDATVIDLRSAAALRRNQADALIAEAEKWERLADSLEASGAPTLGEMPALLAA